MPVPEPDLPVHRPDKLAVLVHVLSADGVQPAALLRGSGLTEAALQRAQTRLTARQLLLVHRRAARLACRPGAALRAGLRMRITHFGLYGYALLSSPSSREAIDFALRYRALASPLIGLDFRIEGDDAVWSFDDVLGLGEHGVLFRFLVELQLGTLLSLHRDLLGPALVPRQAAVCYAAPHQSQLYEALLGCPAAFGQARCELRFDAGLLDAPLAWANPVAADLARQTCDQLLAQMSCTDALQPDALDPSRPGAGSAPRALAERVAQRLLATPGVFPDIETVAGELTITSRTLRRQLQAEGTTFRALLADVRCRLARDYLRTTGMSTEDVAAALGYSDAANFRHAFKRWTGEPPGRHRLR